ncbi:unnamed protein product, partial [marine sediment metagenome]
MSYEEVNGDRARNVVVAVIDKGFGSRNHPDLINKWYKNKTEVLDKKDNDHNGYVDDITGFDFVDRDNDPFLEYDDRSPNSSNSHGQASASIIAAEANNGIGIAGVFNKAYILPLRVDLVHMAEAIQYAIGIGANVIQISGGGGQILHTLYGKDSLKPDPILYSKENIEIYRELKKAIAWAWREKIPILSGVGNTGKFAPVFIGDDWRTITVAPHNIYGEISMHHSFSFSIDIFAPGGSRKLLKNREKLEK